MPRSTYLYNSHLYLIIQLVTYQIGILFNFFFTCRRLEDGGTGGQGAEFSIEMRVGTIFVPTLYPLVQDASIPAAEMIVAE